MIVYALRLRPGQDILGELTSFANAHRLQAVIVLTCVGSLRRASLRLANQPGETLSPVSLKLFRWWDRFLQRRSPAISISTRMGNFWRNLMLLAGVHNSEIALGNLRGCDSPVGGCRDRV